MANDSTQEAASLAKLGSALCTECGLCCTGALHNYAVLEEDETAFFEELGLTLRTSGRPGFALPCPRLVGTKCGIYENRPKACRRYKCQLLHDVQAGRKTLHDALAHVGRAKQYAADVQQLLPDSVTLPMARAEVLEANAEPGVSRELKLALTLLCFYLDRHFRNSNERKMLDLVPLGEFQETTEMT